VGTLPGSATAAFLVALVPAALGLWSGLSLAPLTTDPALPERLMAMGRRLGMAVGVTIVVLVWFCPRFAGWTLPLLFVAHIAAGYPLRRVMREETWSIGTYLWFFIRQRVCPAVAATIGGLAH